MLLNLLTILLSLFYILTTSATFGKDIQVENGILILNNTNFEHAISTNEYIFVKFYAPWCKDSQKFSPEYLKVLEQTKNLKIPVKLAEIDASKEKDLCAKYNILSLPTLKLFRRSAPLSYNGQRKVKNIVQWLKDQVRSAVQELHNLQEVKKAVVYEDMVVIGFFQDSSSKEFKEFVKIADNFDYPPFKFTLDKESRAKFGNESYPITLFKNFDYNKVVFEDEITLDNIRNFVNIESLSLITELNEKNADSIFQGHTKTFLLILASKKSSDIIDMLKPFAREYKKTITFLSINTDDKSNLDILEFFKLQLQDVPTVVIVSNEKDAGKYKLDLPLTKENLARFLQDFNGRRLKKFLVSEKLTDDWNATDVHTLVGSNFENVTRDPLVEVLVLFYGSECETCDLWRDLFHKVGENYRTRSDITVAKIDVDVNEFDEKPYRKIPAVLLYRKGDNSAVIYKGKPKLDDVIQFVNTASEEKSKAKQEL